MSDSSGALRSIFAEFGFKVDEETLDKLDKSVDGLTSKIKEFGLIIAEAFAFKELKEFTEKQIEAGDALFDLSARLGVTTDELQKFQFAAQDAGVSGDEAANALRFLNRNAAAAASGTGETADAFGLLGVKVKDANGQIKPSLQLFEEMAEGFNHLKTPAERTRVSMILLGRAGNALVPFLMGGKEAVEESNKAFEEFGSGLSKEFVDSAKKAQDSIWKLELAEKGLKSQIALNLFPAFIKIEESLAKGIAWFRKFDAETHIVKSTLAGFGVFALVSSVAKLVSLAGGVSNLISLLGKFTLWGLAIAAVIAIVNDLWVTFEGGDSVIRRVLDSLGGIGTTATLVADLKVAFQDLWSWVENTLWPGFRDGFVGLSAGIAEVVAEVEDLFGSLLSGIGKVTKFFGIKDEFLNVGSTGDAISADAQSREERIKSKFLNFYDREHQVTTSQGGPEGPSAALAPPGASITVIQNISGAKDPKAVASEVATKAGTAVDQANKRRTSAAVSTGPRT